MEYWYLCALASTLFLGGVKFITKVAAERGLGILHFTAFSMLSCSVCAALTLGTALWRVNSLKEILVLAALNAAFYAVTFALRVRGLHCLDTVIFFPLYATTCGLMVVVAGVVVFSESLEVKQIAGIVLALAVPLLLIKKSEKAIQRAWVPGLVLIIVASVTGAIATSISKEVVVKSLSLLHFVALSHLLSAIFSAIVARRQEKAGWKFKAAFLPGSLCGIFLFTGFYLYLLALKDGMLSVVYAISSFSLLVPIVLAVIIYRESLNLRKIMAIIAALVSLILLR